MKKCSLSKLPEGETAIVSALFNEACMRRRLEDIGLVAGAEATALYRNNSLRAYLIKGAIVAIRDEDAGKITVIRR